MLAKGKVRFGITMPQKFPDGRVDPGYISEFLGKAESLGYDSVWLGEGVLSSIPNLEPILLLSYASALTSRVKLGVSTIISVLWNPVHLAKSLATLDHLSRGRLIPGVAIGPETSRYPAFGISADGRVSRFEEGIRLMKALWTQEQVTFHGRFWHMDGVSISPRPLQEPHLPLWFGAHAVPALKRAARMGDGWMGSGATSAAEFKEDIRLVRRFLEEEGRDPTSFPISKRVYLALDSDKGRALGKLQDMMGYIYGNPGLAAEVAVFGSEDEVIEGLAEIVKEDIDLVLLHPVYNMIEHAEGLAKDILPKL